MITREPRDVGQLLECLRDARARTLELIEDLTADQLLGPELAIVNPPLWEIGHVAWFQERWTLRHLGGRASLRADADLLYDSAAVDGAGVMQRFWQVTLPGIRPMLVIVALYEVLMAITNFDIVYSLTQGGPGTATTVVTYFTWAESFKKLDFGKGSALAVLIALGSLLVILVLVRAIPRGALVEERR